MCVSKKYFFVAAFHCMHAYIHKHTHTYARARAYVWMCVCVCVSRCRCECGRTYICIHKNIYKIARIYTYISHNPKPAQHRTFQIPLRLPFASRSRHRRGLPVSLRDSPPPTWRRRRRDSGRGIPEILFLRLLKLPARTIGAEGRGRWWVVVTALRIWVCWVLPLLMLFVCLDGCFVFFRFVLNVFASFNAVSLLLLCIFLVWCFTFYGLLIIFPDLQFVWIKIKLLHMLQE